MLQFSMLWSAKLVKLRSHKLHYERRRGVTESTEILDDAIPKKERSNRTHMSMD